MATTTGVVQRITWSGNTVCFSIGPSRESTELFFIQFESTDSDGVRGFKKSMANMLAEAQDAGFLVTVSHPSTSGVVTRTVMGEHGIRQNVAKIPQAERNRLRDAIVELDNRNYPDGVSKWVKQDEIHEVTHVHTEASFLPWHRELCNRFEALLREVDPMLSLHYWDWTDDPRAASDGNGGTVNLFTSNFMGSASGPAGAPFGGFPPISRNVNNGNPGAPGVPADSVIINFANGEPQANQYNVFRRKLEGEHGSFTEPGFNVHSYIGGTIGAPHSAFEDPFVFLLHSNVDRLWAMWQRVPGREWRLDPNQVYGSEGTDPTIVENLEPWDGGLGLRPWAPPDNQQVVKNSKHASVVTPPWYDT